MELKKALMNDSIQEIQNVGDRLVDFLFDLENDMED
jgi:molecular chaperone DnaK